MKDTIFFKLTTKAKEPTKELVELYKNKYGEAKDLDTLKKAEKYLVESGGLSPIFGQIHSITIGFVNESELRVQVLKGAEKDVINTFFNTLRGDFFKGYKTATFSTQFTLPFLTTRMAGCGISMDLMPNSLKHRNCKPWELSTVDVSKDLEGIGFHKGSVLEHAFNIGIDCDIIDGSDVNKYISAGKEKQVDQSDINYIKTLVNVYNTFNGVDMVDEVDSTIKEIEDTTPERLPVLNRICRAKEITETDKKELRGILGGKKLTKKNKKILVDLIHKLSIESDVFKKDSKKVVQEKLETVEKLIEKL